MGNAQKNDAGRFGPGTAARAFLATGIGLALWGLFLILAFTAQGAARAEIRWLEPVLTPAVWAFPILGWGGIVCMLVGIALGLEALHSARKTGRGWWSVMFARLSILAPVCLLVGLFLLITVPGFLEAQPRARVSRAKADMRSLAVALEAYFADHNAFPASATGEESVNGMWFFDNVELQRIPSFKIARGSQDQPTLTTPLAYIDDYPADPFAPEKNATFGYYSAVVNGTAGWILISPGPDRDYDIDPTKVYDPSVEQPSPALLGLTYDPTNGTTSNGDIWRVKE